MKAVFPLFGLLAFIFLTHCVEPPPPPPEYAPVSYPDIHERIAGLQHRIDNGLATGTLTDEEASKLQFRLDKIKLSMEKLETQGVRRPEELARLNNKLDALENDIYKLKHNPRREY